MPIDSQSPYPTLLLPALAGQGGRCFWFSQRRWIPTLLLGSFPSLVICGKDPLQQQMAGSNLLSTKDGYTSTPVTHRSEVQPKMFGYACLLNRCFETF